MAVRSVWIISFFPLPARENAAGLGPRRLISIDMLSAPEGHPLKVPKLEEAGCFPARQTAVTATATREQVRLRVNMGG